MKANRLPISGPSRRREGDVWVLIKFSAHTHADCQKKIFFVSPSSLEFRPDRGEGLFALCRSLFQQLNICSCSKRYATFVCLFVSSAASERNQ